MADPEIVRKVAEALEDHYGTWRADGDPEWGEVAEVAAKAVLTAAAPLIAAQERERIATELHERAQEFVHATPESVAARRELMQAAKIAREAP